MSVDISGLRARLAEADAFYAKIHAAEDALFSSWVDDWHLTDVGRAALVRMGQRLVEATKPHLDNTGAPCRIDLNGHDCCGTCNLAEDALRVLVRYEAP